IESRIINILLQAMASEHASTQRAMKTATDNAETQINKFTRLANSARHAEITQESTEIAGGADALAGSGRTERRDTGRRDIGRRRTASARHGENAHDHHH